MDVAVARKIRDTSSVLISLAPGAAEIVPPGGGEPEGHDSDRPQVVGDEVESLVRHSTDSRFHLRVYPSSVPSVASPPKSHTHGQAPHIPSRTPLLQTQCPKASRCLSAPSFLDLISLHAERAVLLNTQTNLSDEPLAFFLSSSRRVIVTKAGAVMRSIGDANDPKDGDDGHINGSYARDLSGAEERARIRHPAVARAC